jgi:hypothetical protein
MTNSFKLKYWGNSEDGLLKINPYTGRELEFLGKLMKKLSLHIKYDLYIMPSGIGTLDTSLLPNYYHDVSDKYDFMIFTLVNLNGKRVRWPLVYIDVTGSKYSDKESEERYGKPMDAILKTKVDVAFKYSVAGRVYFVLSIDKEDKFRVITALQVMNLYKKGIAKLDSFEEGGKTPYYLIPRDQWKPFKELIVGIKNWYSTISEEFMYRVSRKW